MKLVVFDIDDSIVEESNFMLENAPEFLKNRYGIIIDEVNTSAYDMREVYNLEKHLINKGYSKEEACEKSIEIKKSFWKENFVKYSMLPVVSGVKDVIDTFKKFGYNIHFVSLRGDTGKNDYLLRIVEILTKLQLKRGNIEYDSIKLVDSVRDKVEYINSMNPEFVFEDQPNIINSITSNSKVYCVSRNHNVNSTLCSDAIRIDSFDSINIEKILQELNEENRKCRKFDTLIKRSKISNININDYTKLRKILTETTYSVVTMMGTPIFIKKYHPIVKGKENLLSNGAVAYVGNHRNKLDPVLVAATSSRSIHWGALLRMFQGKESLFSPTKNKIACDLSALFLQSIGAVPIARQTDDDYMNVNLNSINALYQIMNFEGVVGLFPEGTINRKIQEENILPLKSNRIFKMVKDTDGVIQPFSVVWLPSGMEIENKVIINYGFPINTANRNVSEIRDMWFDSVNSGINDANKLVNYLTDISNSSADRTEKDEKVKIMVNKYKNNLQ